MIVPPQTHGVAKVAEEWTQEKVNELYPAVKIGPTWQTYCGEDGIERWLLPRYSIGYDILGWIAEWLTAPDGSGEPFKPTPEQARFIIWFYAVDKYGRWLTQHGILQRLKGWGKDPLAAAICLVELAGPCRFSHFDANGKARGKQEPAPYVQLGAVSLEQTENTRDLFQLIIPERTKQAYNLDVQTIIIYARGRGKLKCVASNPRSNEGGRVSFFLGNETHHWTAGNQGTNFYETLINNLEKVEGRFLAITNAFQPGEDSVAERQRADQERVWAGLAEPDGFLYDSLEAHPKAPLQTDIAPFILETIMGDSYWLKARIRNIVKSFTRGSIPASRSRRMWYNQIVSTEESAFAIDEVEAIIDHSMKGSREDLKPGDRITLGFDGSRTDDSTGLVAYRFSDKAFIPIEIWEKPQGVENWRVSDEDVDSMVGWAFMQYDVVAFFADVHLWESYVAEWSELYRERLLVKASPKSSVGYDMRGNRAAIQTLNEALIGLVRDQKVKLNGDPRLKAHFLNAERRWGGGFLSFGKKGGRESPRKIDGLIAASLALQAAFAVSESGKTPKKQYTRRLIQN